MSEYWESKFKAEGAMWRFEPSDSASIAVELFEAENLHHILIPGIGYGRNAGIFYEHGFKLTGIEISKSAIDIARANGLDFKIHHGSVLSMPFDNERYDGIFCYALIHLLNLNERRRFLTACYNQLIEGGIMIFVVATTQMSMYGTGKFLSKDRYRISSGLNVFFYDDASVINEFTRFGLTTHYNIAEPVKFTSGFDPMPLKFVMCKKG
jgi:SAM-dependent methyltransferase